MKFSLCPMSEKWLDEAAAIYNSNPDFLDHHLGMDQITPAFIREEWEEMKKARFHSCLLFSEEESEPIGLCDFSVDGKEAYLSLLMIRGPLRDQGLGSQAFSFLKTEFQKNASCVRIDVVFGFPGSPFGFWEKQGFQKVRPITLTWHGMSLQAYQMALPL